MVLELFLTEYFYGKKIKELYENYENDKLTFFISMAMRLILTLPMTVIAVILAWRCNSSEPTYLRILYTTLAAPNLPNSVIKLFDTMGGKLLLLFLIGLVASRNIQVSLMVAVAFLVTLHLANQIKTSATAEELQKVTSFYTNLGSS